MITLRINPAVSREKLGLLYTVSEAAKILNVSEKTVRRLIKDERLKTIEFRATTATAGPCGLIRRNLSTLSETIEVGNCPILSGHYHSIGKLSE